MIRYWSLTEVSRYIGVIPSTARKYKLPVEDAQIGNVRGWLPERIMAWHANRPGRGARTDLYPRNQDAERSESSI